MPWSIRLVPQEVHIRASWLPALRLDVSRDQAATLLLELAKALETPAPQRIKVPLWLKVLWWWRAFREAHSATGRAAIAARREAVQRQLNSGGWY